MENIHLICFRLVEIETQGTFVLNQRITAPTPAPRTAKEILDTVTGGYRSRGCHLAQRHASFSDPPLRGSAIAWHGIAYRILYFVDFVDFDDMGWFCNPEL